MKKLTKTASTLNNIFSVAEKVLFALAIAAIVCIVLIAASWLLGWNPDMIGTGYENFDIGFVELQIAEAYAPDKWLVLLQAAITLLVSCRLFYDGRKGIGYVRQILQPMKEEKPFASVVSTNLGKLARLSINLGILYNIIILSEQVMTVFVYDLPGLLISEKIAHVGGMFQVDLTFIVYWAVLLLLSYIFRYGEELQQLSDETL